MTPVEIYTRPFCPYCTRARRLLDARGIAFEEIDVHGDAVADACMRERSGRTSVPQVFVGGRHVGGSDELAAADASGLLARLVGEVAVAGGGRLPVAAERGVGA